MKKTVKTIITATLITASLSMSACATTQGRLEASANTSGIFVSRATLYESINELLQDTVLVVRGVVISQDSDSIDAENVKAAIPTTISKFKITEIVQIDQRISSDLLKESISVEQIGTPNMDTVPEPFLEVGQEYLLFLHNGMPETATIFGITGGAAGIYQAAENEVYKWLGNPESDNLPMKLTLTEINKFSGEKN